MKTSGQRMNVGQAEGLTSGLRLWRGQAVGPTPGQVQSVDRPQVEATWDVWLTRLDSQARGDL